MARGNGHKGEMEAYQDVSQYQIPTTTINLTTTHDCFQKRIFTRKHDERSDEAHMYEQINAMVCKGEVQIVFGKY